MRKLTFLFPVFLALVVLALAGCGSSRSFSSRKYTAGNYISHKHKAGKTTVHESPEQEPVAAAKEETPPEKAGVAGKAGQPEDELLSTGKTALGMASPERSAAAAAAGLEKTNRIEKKETTAKALRSEVFRNYMANRTERKCLAYDDGDNSLDSVALVSFILGVLGLVLNILALSVIVATSEYVFALMFIAGMVMGIIAVVFGTQGLRRYHKNKSGTINLVFSIIGTAFGAGAIITAFVFSFYTLVLFLEGLG